jgi:hypothetical protein
MTDAIFSDLLLPHLYLWFEAKGVKRSEAVPYFIKYLIERHRTTISKIENGREEDYAGHYENEKKWLQKCERALSESSINDVERLNIR